ncbi:hypothetical protein V2H77_03060 [Photorhabdus sp. P32]|uniref:hypothetical protein n=1 Tax=Photorhabdus sp. P32 TaxID=3117549 RepID=UPI00311AE2C3
MKSVFGAKLQGIDVVDSSINLKFDIEAQRNEEIGMLKNNKNYILQITKNIPNEDKVNIITDYNIIKS